MLVAVERAPPALVFDPDTEVFELVIYVSAGDQQLFGMAPIDADIVQRAVDAEGGEIAENLAERGDKFGPAPLAGRHRAGATIDRPETARVTVGRPVVGRIGERRGGALLTHQRGKGRGIESGAAQHPIVAEDPQIPDFAERRIGRQLGHLIYRVVFSLARIVERLDPQIDLSHLEADDFDAEIETEQGEVPELLRQQPIVPGCDLGEPVVRDPERAHLRRGQVIEAQRRHLAPAKLSCRKQPAMAGYDISITIDQDRNTEPKSLDAFGDLPDLLPAVPARVGGVWGELVDPPIDDFTRLGPPDRHRVSPVVLCRFHRMLLRCAR